MALTSPSLYVTRRRSSGPSHHRGFCCPVGSSGTTAAPDSHPARSPFPGSSPVIGADAPTTPIQSTAGPGRVSQVPVATLSTFRAPYAGRSLGAATRFFTPSVAFAVTTAARLLLSPTLTGGRPNDAAGFASRYGPLSCSPQRGFRRWASTQPVSRLSRQPATGPPGSYPDGTHTRRRQRAYVGSGQLKQPPPTTWHTLGTDEPVRPIDPPARVPPEEVTLPLMKMSPATDIAGELRLPPLWFHTGDPLPSTHRFPPLEVGVPEQPVLAARPFAAPSSPSTAAIAPPGRTAAANADTVRTPTMSRTVLRLARAAATLPDDPTTRVTPRTQTRWRRMTSTCSHMPHAPASVHSHVQAGRDSPATRDCERWLDFHNFRSVPHPEAQGAEPAMTSRVGVRACAFGRIVTAGSRRATTGVQHRLTAATTGTPPTTRLGRGCGPFPPTQPLDDVTSTAPTRALARTRAASYARGGRARDVGREPSAQA